MVMALLAAAAVTPPVLVGETVTVNFAERGKVNVTGPTPMSDNPEYPWTAQQTLLSPRGDAAAVRFCWEAIKYHGCLVHLVRPSGIIQTLKNSNVTRLLWTPDGKYLIGAGANTVRLWNLVGGVRAHVPRAAENRVGMMAQTRNITNLRFQDGFLCVSLLADVFRKSGGYAIDTLSTTTRYSIPMLTAIEAVTMPVKEEQEAPCHMPSTEP